MRNARVREGYTLATGYPDTWKSVILEELISDLRGGAPFKPDDFTDEGFPVLHKGAIKPFGEIEIDKAKKTFTTAQFAEKYSKSIVDKRYIVATLRDLIPSGPSIGLMSYLKRTSHPQYVLAQGAYGFIVDETRLEPDYLVFLSNTSFYRKYIKTLAVGSTQIHVRTPVFTELEIPLPPLEEQ